METRYYKRYGAKKSAELILLDVFLYGCSKNWVGEDLDVDEIARYLNPFNIKFKPNTFGSWELKEFKIDFMLSKPFNLEQIRSVLAQAAELQPVA